MNLPPLFPEAFTLSLPQQLELAAMQKAAPKLERDDLVALLVQAHANYLSQRNVVRWMVKQLSEKGCPCDRNPGGQADE